MLAITSSVKGLSLSLSSCAILARQELYYLSAKEDMIIDVPKMNFLMAGIISLDELKLSSNLTDLVYLSTI